MKTPIEVAQVRDLVHQEKLNTSQVLREIRVGLSKVSDKDKELIQAETVRLRSQIRSYLSVDGTEELLCKIGWLLLEKDPW